VCAAVACCWDVTWAAVQLDHLAVACASLQPDLLSHGTFIVIPGLLNDYMSCFLAALLAPLCCIAGIILVKIADMRIVAQLLLTPGMRMASLSLTI